jgi:hypothetical protein
MTHKEIAQKVKYEMFKQLCEIDFGDWIDGEFEEKDREYADSVVSIFKAELLEEISV